MQKHAPQPLLGQALVQGKVTILIIPDNAMALAGQVYADLVGAPGFDRHFQQTHGRQPLQGARWQALAQLHQRQRGHGIRGIGGGGAHAPLPIGQQVFVQGRINHFFIGWPAALHQSQIGFTGRALAKLVLQGFEGRAFFRHQQNARGFAVQPVYQLQKLRLRAGPAQLLNHAKTHPAATVYGHPCRFIQGDKRLVLKQNRKFTRRSGNGIGGFFCHAHRGQAHGIARLHTGIGRAAAFVDAHLAAADDAVHMGFGHPL